MMKSKKEETAADMETVRMERSLRLLPPQYSPSLVFCHGKKFRDQTFCTLSDGCYHVRSIPEMRQMRCIASCHGWLIMQSFFDSTQCHLFEPISLTKIQLPPLKDKSFRDGVLTSPPSDRNNNCIVLFVSTYRKSFIRCRIGDKKWIEKDLGPKTEMSKLTLENTSVLSCGGKTYTFYRYGMFVIDVHDDSFATKLYKRDLWQPSLPDCMRADFFYVESCGEIFYIMLIYLGASDCIIQKLDVFKLDISTMAWVRVHNLGDRVFLLGASSSTSLSSTELGVKGNCIYICSEKYTCLNRFDMVSGTLTTTLPCPKKFKDWRGPFWVVPNCKLQPKNDTADVEVKEAKGLYEEKGSKKDLPTEMLELILSNLFLSDYCRLRLSCKALITISPPNQPYTSLIQSESEAQQLPWFLTFQNDNNGLCNFHHPIYSDANIMNIPDELAGATIRHTKYGWLLMSQGENSIFFFSPFTMETIKLPKLNYTFENISFSSPPTSNDCVVFGHSDSSPCSVTISVYRKCEDAWSTYDIDTLKLFLPSHCSPVLCDGVFYSLGKDGQLGIFNPNETEEENMWKLLPITLPPEISSSFWLNVLVNFFHSFIMELEGEILSVFVGRWGKPFYVYKLDQSKMEWNKVESLGDKIMFLSRTATILAPARLKGLENRIYLPRYEGRDQVFYSLSSGMYHFLGGKGSRDDWMNTSEHWNCTWIQFNS